MRTILWKKFYKFYAPRFLVGITTLLLLYFFHDESLIPIMIVYHNIEEILVGLGIMAFFVALSILALVVLDEIY